MCPLCVCADADSRDQLKLELLLLHEVFFWLIIINSSVAWQNNQKGIRSAATEISIDTQLLLSSQLKDGYLWMF